MSDWRDDLPPIPADRIRTEAIREGTRRHAARVRRQQTVLYGGMGVFAVGLIVVGALIATNSDDGDDDDSAGAATTAGGGTATSAAPATTASGAGVTGALGTTAAPATEAPALTAPTGTEAAATTAPAAETTFPDYTTISGPIAARPSNDEVIIFPITIWEQPAEGPECGPTTYLVTFQPGELTPRAPVAHWETAGVRDEVPMVLDEFRAHASVGPFPADTLEEGVTHEVLVYVTEGDEIFRGPTVILRDCSP